MSERRLIDTNLIVRHLVQDQPEHAKAAGRLFAAADRGEMRLFILPIVVAEAVFVLESFYKHPRESISKTLSTLLSSPGVETLGLEVQLDALKRYQQTNAHFVDCVIAATAGEEKCLVASFDSDFKKFRDVNVSLK